MTKKQPSKIERALEQYGLTEKQALDLFKSSTGKPSKTHKYKGHGPTSTVRYIAISDAHIGHKSFDEQLFLEAVKRANKEKVDFVVDPGDHLEGMSGRPGHVYELDQVGYNAQLGRAVELYNQFNVPIFGIDGNHDQWFKQKHDMGVVVGEDLEKRVKNYTHLGEWEGRLDLGKGVDILLFHANDGTAYATSYKLQKLIESFTGGEKPSIVHSGHYHKSMYAFIRNVHGFETGTICGQSQFMRGKKIPAHKGYWDVTVKFNTAGIHEITPKFIPAYD